MLSLARAYCGYDIYFPAFQDFRGRIYRTGIFNLHERDLYRSLLLFKVPNEITRKLSLEDIPKVIKVATYKHYSSIFKSNEEGIRWFDNWFSELRDKDVDDYIIEYMKKAKDPFQFLRKALLVLKGGCFEAEPVFMDASSSAYQIMSYLLQDLKLAQYTNLIKSSTRNDLYTIMLDKYVSCLRDEGLIDSMIEPYFTRKLVKSLVMPLTYGKTVIAMSDDISRSLGKYKSRQQCMQLASRCHKIWCDYFPGVHNILKLFGMVGGICSSLNRVVKLPTPLFSSYQDYRKFEKQHVCKKQLSR